MGVQSFNFLFNFSKDYEDIREISIQNFSAIKFVKEKTFNADCNPVIR